MLRFPDINFTSCVPQHQNIKPVVDVHKVYLTMGRSCNRWNSGWFVRWRNLNKRTKKAIAVVTMNTDSRPASRGSRVELDR